MEFIFGLKVSLSWGNAKTKLLERGNTGVPQGSLEGMWNFSVYSDNIDEVISEAVGGTMVGEEMVRAVIYADDLSPINPSPVETNAALYAISKAGTFNAYKFKPLNVRLLVRRGTLQRSTF